MRIYLISSCGQPTRVGPPAWGLGEMLTTPHRKNLSCYEIFTRQYSDKNEMVGACSAYGGEESRIQGFGGET